MLAAQPREEEKALPEELEGRQGAVEAQLGELAARRGALEEREQGGSEAGPDEEQDRGGQRG